MNAELQYKVDHAISAVESFSMILDQETSALKTSNYALFEQLQPAKIALAQDYQDSILAFEEDVDVLKSLEDGVKEKLRRAHARFAAAAEANQSALLACKNVAERIVKMIMDAARRTVSDAPSYSAAGMVGLSDKIPVHFKLNETL